MDQYKHVSNSFSFFIFGSFFIFCINSFSSYGAGVAGRHRRRHCHCLHLHLFLQFLWLLLPLLLLDLPQRGRGHEHGRVRDVGIVGTWDRCSECCNSSDSWISQDPEDKLSICVDERFSPKQVSPFPITVLTIIITLTLSLAQVTTLHWMFYT